MLGSSEVQEQQAEAWSPTEQLEKWPSDWQKMSNVASHWYDSQTNLTCPNSFMLDLIAKNVRTRLDHLPLFIKTLNNLACLAFNLFMFPWKQEYHRIGTCTGFYTHTLRQVADHENVLRLMGYEALADDSSVLEFRLRSGTMNLEDYQKQLKCLMLDLFSAEAAVRRLLARSPQQPTDLLPSLARILPQISQHIGTEDPPVPAPRSRQVQKQVQQASLQQPQRPQAKRTTQPGTSSALPATSSSRPAANMTNNYQSKETRV